MGRTDPNRVEELKDDLRVVTSQITANTDFSGRSRRALGYEDRTGQRERRRQAREAAAARQALDLAEGWPEAWTTGEVTKARALGAGPDDATMFSTAGWHAREVLALWRDDRSRLHERRVPEGDPATHRLHADTLCSLLDGEWPGTPPRTALSLKRTLASGRRHRWAVFPHEGGWRVRHWTARRPGSWRLVSEQPATGVLEVLTDVPALRLVRTDVVNEYTLDRRVADPLSLVQLLRLPPRDDVDCGGSRRDEVDEWWQEGQLVESIVPGLPLVARWCRVGDYAVAGVPRGRRLVPVAADLDQEVLVPRRALAEHTWYSESGGAPISWNGGSRLAVLEDGLLLAQWWGDDDLPPKLVECRQTPRNQARAIADWLDEQQLDVLAAMRLEPFDPRETLTPAERDVWSDRFEAVTAHLYLDVGSECLDILRRLLRRRPAYRRTRAALATPNGRAGRALAAVLDDLETNGVLGDLLYGSWAD